MTYKIIFNGSFNISNTINNVNIFDKSLTFLIKMIDTLHEYVRITYLFLYTNKATDIRIKN